VALSQPRVDGLAVAGMVLGILGIFLGWLWLTPPILGIIFGAVGLHRINNSGGRITGNGMAVAGLTLGIIGTVLWGLIFLLVIPA
jgi:hypothetical protein